MLKTEIETAGEGQTILQIPEDLLPIFIPKKDPVKLGTGNCSNLIYMYM